MAQTAQLRTIEHAENEAQRVFALQRAAYLAHPYPTLEERRDNLKKLDRILVENAQAIAEAINADFGHRAVEETLMAEIFGTVDGIRHTLKHVAKWMRPQKRSVAITFAGASNTVIPQPKGVVGVVSPWNYPLFLTAGPLTSILAAGNRAMIKMATNSQHLARLLAEKFAAVYPEDTVAILPGVRAQDFSTLPFDHIIFTGSADAGRTVMRSAAENLTPVTLELGGKSPTIVCDDFDVDEAASRILYAKYLNAGQTCLAPDYLLISEANRDRFVEAAKRIMPVRYPDTNQQSYTSVIDDKSYKRLRATLEDARQKGATVVPLVPNATFNDQLRKIPPHLVLDVTDDMIIMQEEIFGPLFPVKTYRTLDEVVAYVNAKDRPLGSTSSQTTARARRSSCTRPSRAASPSTTACSTWPSTTCPSAASAPAAWATTTATRASSSSRSSAPVFRNPRFSMLSMLYPPYTGADAADSRPADQVQAMGETRRNAENGGVGAS